MSERITRRHLEFRIERLTKALGRPKLVWEPRKEGGGNQCTVGAFAVEHVFGGWQISETSNDGGAVSHPFGSQIMSGWECLHVLEAALAGIEMARKGGVK